MFNPFAPPDIIQELCEEPVISEPNQPMAMMPNGTLATNVHQAYDLGYAQACREREQQPEPRQAPEFLERALRALQGNARLRDAPGGERSAPRARDILEAWTGRQWCETDIWRVLFAVKMAREMQGQFHADDIVDLTGYAALLGESRVKLEREVFRELDDE
jgi:hypothetical protein